MARQLLYVTPFYGYGWSRDGLETESEAVDVPDPFHLRLTRLWHWRDERRGGVGRIESRDHELYGQWVVFGTRHEGTYDFERRIAAYNMSIAADEPVDSDDGWPRSRASVGLMGYGEIRLATPE